MADDIQRYVGGHPMAPTEPIAMDGMLALGTRNWKLGPPMRKPPYPEAMPDLRHNLMDGWAQWWPNPFESSTHIQMLQNASLWWVGEEMCDLLYSTMAAVPAETEVSNLVVPEQMGLVFFAKEWEGVLDSQTGEPGGNVDCIAWADETRIGSDSQQSLSVASYRYLDFDNGLTSRWDTVLAAGMGYVDAAQAVRDKLARMGAPSKVRQTDLGLEVAMTGGVWVPLGRSDWPHGWRLDAPSAAYGVDLDTPLGLVGTEAFDLSAQEDRRLISALFTLLNTASLATVEERKPSRQVVRNAQRKGTAVPASVKVVYLRRPKMARKPGEPEVEHHYSHRFAVRAHPRMQAYGPRHSLRRLIMVPAHIKGPDDAPFVAKETVNAWVR
jgi:hypothetical protein